MQGQIFRRYCVDRSSSRRKKSTLQKQWWWLSEQISAGYDTKKSVRFFRSFFFRTWFSSKPLLFDMEFRLRELILVIFDISYMLIPGALLVSCLPHKRTATKWRFTIFFKLRTILNFCSWLQNYTQISSKTKNLIEDFLILFSFKSYTYSRESTYTRKRTIITWRKHLYNSKCIRTQCR